MADAVLDDQAVEYAPGELAPAIVTQSQVWKPDDLNKSDKTLQGAIKGLVESVSNTDDAARRFSVLECWQTRHMDRGYQHLMDNGSGGWEISGSNCSKSRNGISEADDQGLYPTNILSAQGDISTSALCRGEIKVNFAPRNSKDPRDSACADEANKYKYLWAKANCQMQLQRELMGYGWTDCRVVAWTRSVADRSRFGVDTTGKPKVVEVTTLHGVLESKLPMMVDRLEEAGYAQVFEEVDYAQARASYPWMGDKIKPSWGTYGEQEFERIARINTRIGIVGKYITGTSGIREATMGYNWFRPGMYWDDSIQASQRDWLLENFPAGLFVIMAGPEMVCCWDESMDDHLALGMYSRGFGQNRRSLGSSDVPIQKRINIWADLWDKYVRSVPFVALDADAYNTEAIAQLESSPRRFVPVAPRDGQAIPDTFSQSPQVTPTPGMAEMFQWYVGPLIQSIDGMTPALFGQGEGQDNTVGATQIRLQQALERIGTAWVMANILFAKCVTQAVKCCAENGTEELYDTVPGVGDVAVDPMKLKGDPECFAETINGIPESGAQREAKVMQVLEMAQTNQQMSAILSAPSNAREIVKALHIDDVITVEQAESEDLALENIERLLMAEPLLNPKWQQLSDQIQQLDAEHEQAKGLAAQVVSAGAPIHPEAIQAGQAMEDHLKALSQQLQQTPKYLPSVPVAEDESEDNSTIALTVFAWMQEPEGRALKRAAQGEGEGQKNWMLWQNVWLYWQGNKMAAAKTAAANTPPVPVKASVTVDPSKLTGEAQASALQLAGIQSGQAAGAEVEQETFEYTPVSEVKTRVRRRL